MGNKNSALGNSIRKARYLEGAGLKQINLLVPPASHASLRELAALLRTHPRAEAFSIVSGQAEAIQAAEDRAAAAEERAAKAEAEVRRLRSLGPHQWVAEKILHGFS